MAYLYANCTRYDHVTTQETDGTVKKVITVGGNIYDDAFPEPLYAECVITGSEYDALPAVDPQLDGTPNDPRFQAIEVIVKQFISDTYAKWVATRTAVPLVEAKPQEVLAMLPVITVLPPPQYVPGDGSPPP